MIYTNTNVSVPTPHIRINNKTIEIEIFGVWYYMRFIFSANLSRLCGNEEIIFEYIDA